MVSLQKAVPDLVENSLLNLSPIGWQRMMITKLPPGFHASVGIFCQSSVVVNFATQEK